MLVEETTVPSAALPVAKLKDHLRMGSGFADDTLQDDVLESCLRAALAAIEARTGKITIQRNFSVTFTSWRDPQTQPLPLAPVDQLVDITLLDITGSVSDAAMANVVLVKDTHRPRIVSKLSGLPAIPVSGHAKVQVIAGFGPNWGDIPADLAQAVMLLAAHFYDNRLDYTGQRHAMPFGVSALIERFRNIRVFGGGTA